jgi:hypothetical protein
MVAIGATDLLILFPVWAFVGVVVWLIIRPRQRR